MKKLLILAAVSVLFSSCGDSVDSAVGFSKPQLRSTEPDPAATIQFPEERTITDLNGRSIKVRLIGKKGDRISFEKLPSLKRFILPLEKLARADQLALSTVPDGGDFASFGGGGVQLGANRKAVWHSQIINAEKEAARSGIPMLVAVISADDESGSELEKNLVYSREFKKWADRNVTLCLQRVGSDSRETTYKTWQSLVKYGIRQSSMSSLALINPNSFKGVTIPTAGAATGDQVLAQLKHALNTKSLWVSISPASAPTRESSPFKVNGGAKIVGGGSCAT